mgnify:CR=1 FL=1
MSGAVLTIAANSFREAVRDHLGAGDARRDAVRADAARAIFAGHVLGERFQAALGRRIGPAATAADVRLADARIAQTTAQRQLQLAQQRPSFAGSLGLQRIGQDSGSPPGLGPVLSVGVTLPFTAGRANRARGVSRRR